MIILEAQWHFTVRCTCGVYWDVGVDAAEVMEVLDFHRSRFHTTHEERTLPIHISSYVSMFDRRPEGGWSRIGHPTYLGWVAHAASVYGVTIGIATANLHQTMTLL